MRTIMSTADSRISDIAWGVVAYSALFAFLLLGWAFVPA